MMTIEEIMKRCNEIKARDNGLAIERASQKFGFNPKGWVWLLLEDLTNYDRKESFRSVGGRFDKILGWHSPDRIDGFKMKKVMMNTLGEVVNGVWQTRRYKVDVARKEACRAKMSERQSKSEFVGVVGVKDGLVTEVRLVSVRETMFRDANFEIPGYYGLPFRHDFNFVDRDGNQIRFSSAYYQPKMVQEWFGKGWAKMTAKVILHDDRHGVKITKVIFPEFTKKRKGSLKEYARINNPETVGEMPLDLIACDS